MSLGFQLLDRQNKQFKGINWKIVTDIFHFFLKVHRLNDSNECKQLLIAPIFIFKFP